MAMFHLESWTPQLDLNYLMSAQGPQERLGNETETLEPNRFELEPTWTGSGLYQNWMELEPTIYLARIGGPRASRDDLEAFGSLSVLWKCAHTPQEVILNLGRPRMPVRVSQAAAKCLQDASKMALRRFLWLTWGRLGLSWSVLGPA